MSLTNTSVNDASNHLVKNPAGGSATANIFDVSGLATLKRQVKAGDAASHKAVAKQFEALFMQMVLKSMRDATPHDGLFNSDQTQMYESLLDQQLGQSLSGSHRGLGLAAMIEAQLSRQKQDPQGVDYPLPLHPAAATLPLSRQGGLTVPQGMPPQVGAVQAGTVQLRANQPLIQPTLLQPPLSANVASPTEVKSAATAAQREFVQRLLPAALSAQQKTGIPAHFTVAHAALETGWGKSEPRGTDGRQSFNLFGIKASAGWRGASVEAVTTEVIAGVAQRRVERFRAYGSYAEAMNDYAQLLTNNPRYAGVLGAREPARFAQELQSAGFATDPNYASKLMGVMGSNTLRQAVTG
ncbi:MAG: flagellar assembly peptidoglycan hydrolase FlgJ [Rugosibacter sp.]|jgi:flagellar protein FlgJ